MKKLKHFWEEFKAFISHLNDQLEKDNPYDKHSIYKNKKIKEREAE